MLGWANARAVKNPPVGYAVNALALPKFSPRRPMHRLDHYRISSLGSFPVGNWHSDFGGRFAGNDARCRPHCGTCRVHIYCATASLRGRRVAIGSVRHVSSRLHESGEIDARWWKFTTSHLTSSGSDGWRGIFQKSAKPANGPRDATIAARRRNRLAEANWARSGRTPRAKPKPSESESEQAESAEK